jgi:hypothetical protein
MKTNHKPARGVLSGHGRHNPSSPFQVGSLSLLGPYGSGFGGEVPTAFPAGLELSDATPCGERKQETALIGRAAYISAGSYL